MKPRFIFLLGAASLLCLSAAAQYIPVQPNPFGERPVLAPVPTLVADVSEPVLTLSEEHDAVRMEVARPDGPVTMIINIEWNYPMLGVGNYMKPPIVFGDGYTNTVHLRPIDIE